MSRTHPPTLLTLARRTIQHHRLIGRGERVLVATSGGPDSMALLHVLARLRPEFGFDLLAHGVDHGLRAEGAQELDIADELAQHLSVPFGRTRLAVARGGNLQARARAARYEALRAAAAAAGAHAIATGHHADDRAETVLLRLLRGAGPQGLAVLPPRADPLIRPFIRARRDTILAHTARHGVPFAADPSNQDVRFLRTRVRFEVLPLLSQLSPKMVEHLCALADQLSEPMSALRMELDPLIPQLPLLGRAHREALQALQRSASRKGRVALPGGLVAAYDGAQECMVIASKGGSGWKHRP